eukprot:s5396_g5.t1
MVEADPRDPRALRTQWPCYGDHPEVAIGNNKFGQWKSCAVCSYRLSYTPREGAPGSDSKTENFPTVRRALSRLYEDIGDVRPDAEMVRVAIEMEYASCLIIINHVASGSLLEDRQTLESRQRHERTMLKRMVDFLAWALNRNSLLEIFWEWPAESLGWKEPVMQHLEKSVWLRNRDWLQCRVDGCRYGMRLDNKGPFVKKRWAIRTACPKFHSLFKTKVVLTIRGGSSAPLPRKSMLYSFAGEEAEDNGEPEEEERAAEDSGVPDGPTEEERKAWDRKLRRFHTAAGHPSNSQLSRIIKEAGKPKWMVEAAARFSCPHCESSAPGGMSSKQVPPLSTRPIPVAWQQVVSDVGEWTSIPHKCKLKFVVFVDAATKLRVAEPLFRCEISEMKTETGLQLVEASYASKHFQDFCSSVNIWLAPPAEAEAWAHGLAESVVQDVKAVMERIQTGDASLLPETCLALATGALNQTSFVKGYSSYQWAYGKHFSYTDEDEITMSQVRDDAPFAEFSRLLSLRHDAENKAREVRAQRVLSKLKNTIQRQPLRTFHPVDLVKVWRRALPQELHRGRAGGTKKAGRHHWIGPGRVVLQETVPHQAEDDPRRHIVWVVIGGKLCRCSAHSVRPVAEQERAWHHLQVDEDPSRWKSLQDIIPSKEYTDLSGQPPPGDLPEDADPDPPQAPDSATWVPSKRLKGKQAPAGDVLPQQVPPPVNDYDVPEDCRDYEPGLGTDFGNFELPTDSEMTSSGEKREAPSESDVAPPAQEVYQVAFGLLGGHDA